MSAGFVMRFVVTHLNKDGDRVLAHPQQGRYTHFTRELAETHIAEVLLNNHEDVVNKHYGLPLKVRECKCYPGHFDPAEYYFED